MASKFAEIYVLLGLKKEGFDKEIKATKSSLGDLGKDMVKFAAVAGGVAVAIGVAGKAIYAVGKRGAIVTQTGDSFEFLIEKLGLAPDLLEQLRKAARGTVDDMTLMSSTATLLAGTSDELGKKLGDATPKLLEIAKAANKLNPQLGDTAFMFSSIATGVKRAQPLILDNLGLTIKVGAANEVMAKELGKSVEALTAEEKAMAILNATLDAGETMIAQVGGTTESATDSFLVMETNVKNLKDTFMKGLSPAIAEATGRLSEFMMKQIEGTELQKYTTQLLEDKIITDKQALVATMNLAKGIWDLDNAMEYLSHHIPDVTDETLALGDQYDETRVQGELLFLEMDRGIGVLDDYRAMTEEAETATWNFSSAMAGAKGAIEGLVGVLENQYQNALKNATNSVYEFERAKLVLKIASGDLKGATDAETQANIENAFAMLDSIERMEILNKAVKDGEISQRDYKLALLDGKITLGEFNDLLGITAGTMDGAEGEAYSLRGETDLLGGSLDTAAGRALALEGAIGRLKSKTITITTRYKSIGTPPPRPGKGEDYIPFQHGTDFIVPPGYPGDSFLFPMALSSGERVEVTPKSEVGRMGKGRGTTNFNNLNIYTNAPVESDVPELLLLRAWSNG